MPEGNIGGVNRGSSYNKVHLDQLLLTRDYQKAMACILAAGIVITAEAISRQHEKRKIAKAAERKALIARRVQENLRLQIEGEVGELLGEEELPPYTPKDELAGRPIAGRSNQSAGPGMLPQYEKVFTFIAVTLGLQQSLHALSRATRPVDSSHTSGD